MNGVQFKNAIKGNCYFIKMQ